MKINEINTSDPIKTLEGVVYFKMPRPLPDSNEEVDPKTYEFKTIRTLIFTDGEVAKVENEKAEKVDSFYIKSKKLKNSISEVKTSDVYLDNYTYIITCLIAREGTPLYKGRGAGYFDFIKDVKVYAKDKKDKQARKNIRNAMNEILNHFGYCNGEYIYNYDNYGYSYETLGNDVYSLNRKMF